MDIPERLAGVDRPALPKDDFYALHMEDITKVMSDIHTKTILGKLTGNQLVQTVHHNIDEMQAHLKFKDYIQCDKQECSFCCHSEIFISKDEAAYIKTKGTYTIDAERQAKQRITTYKQLSFADKACIMLKDGKCQVYANRPALCRNHAASIGIDPEDCHKQNIDQNAGHWVEQPRNIPLEAFQMYLTLKGSGRSLQGVKNIADFDW